MSASDNASSRNQSAALAAGWAHVATIGRQPLHGVGSSQPETVSAEECIIADAAYKAATGTSVLGVGITAALGAAAVVRAASIKPAPVQGCPWGIPWSRLREALRPASFEAPLTSTEVASEAGSPDALIVAYAAANVNWAANPDASIAAIYRAHQNLASAFAERDALIWRLTVERDDLLRRLSEAR